MSMSLATRSLRAVRALRVQARIVQQMSTTTTSSYSTSVRHAAAATSSLSLQAQHQTRTTTARSMTTTTTAASSTDGKKQDQDSSSKNEFSNPETVILEKALLRISEHGWTVDALAAGAQDAGYPSVAHGMLPRGAIDLVDYFMDKCHQQMRERLIMHRDELQRMPVTERLKFGVRTRLELLAPVLATWPQAMALGALPSNAPTTMHKLALLSDDIWYFAGDQSVDASWYTKRALLTGIYASTELFMLSDESPSFQDTWTFLDRRVEETVALGELPSNLGDVAGMATIGLQSFLSAAVSLAGPLSSQLVKNSPLGQMPNPISAVGEFMPPQPPSFTTAAQGVQAHDLHGIDAELERLGAAQDNRQ